MGVGEGLEDGCAEGGGAQSLEGRGQMRERGVLWGQTGPETPPQHRLPPPQGRQLESVKAEAAEKGDVGLVAENSRSTQRLMLPPPALTAAGVFARFRDIARLAGSAVSAAGGHPGPQTLGPFPGWQRGVLLVRLFGDWVASVLLVGTLGMGGGACSVATV